MAKKSKPDQNGFVYSTDPGFGFDRFGETDGETPPPAKQKLRLLLDSRKRAGKTVTAVIGFIGKEEDLDALGKKCKQFCGTGGGVKEREILVQGDQLIKLKAYLLKEGYKVL